MSHRISVIALIGANMIPLAGVIWLDWAVFDVMVLYWAENVVIGVINVMRMLKCTSKSVIPITGDGSISAGLTDTQQVKVSRITSGIGYFMIPFFVVHYGMFCFGHYSAVAALFGDGYWQRPLWIGVAAIALSHLVSFFVNFIGRREYEHTNIAQLMQRPYGRIIVLHVSIIAGGFLVTVLDNPFWMLPVLVIVKTSIDLRMHLAERQIFAASAAPA